jgi:hypothetical protein
MNSSHTFEQRKGACAAAHFEREEDLSRGEVRGAMDAQEQQHALKGRQKLEEVRRKKAAAAAAGSGQVLTTPFFWFLPDQIMA